MRSVMRVVEPVSGRQHLLRSRHWNTLHAQVHIVLSLASGGMASCWLCGAGPHFFSGTLRVAARRWFVFGLSVLTLDDYGALPPAIYLDKGESYQFSVQMTPNHEYTLAQLSLGATLGTPALSDNVAAAVLSLTRT